MRLGAKKGTMQAEKGQFTYNICEKLGGTCPESVTLLSIDG